MIRNSFLKAGVTALAALGLAAAVPAQAQTTIVGFSFDSQNLVADSGLSSNKGVTTITATGLSNATPDGKNGIAYAKSGASGGSTDYYLRAGIGTGGNAPTSNENGFIQFAVSTAGYNATTVSFYGDNSNATSGAFTTETVYYSTNGTTFTQAAVETLGQNFVQYTVNLSALSGGAIDNNANAAVRIVFSGSTAYTGMGGPNARVDALTLTGTPIAAAPEPSGVVALAMGAGVLGLMVARRRKVVA